MSFSQDFPQAISSRVVSVATLKRIGVLSPNTQATPLVEDDALAEVFPCWPSAFERAGRNGKATFVASIATDLGNRQLVFEGRCGWFHDLMPISILLNFPDDARVICRQVKIDAAVAREAQPKLKVLLKNWADGRTPRTRTVKYLKEWQAIFALKLGQDVGPQIHELSETQTHQLGERQRERVTALLIELDEHLAQMIEGEPK